VKFIDEATIQVGPVTAATASSRGGVRNTFRWAAPAGGDGVRAAASISETTPELSTLSSSALSAALPPKPARRAATPTSRQERGRPHHLGPVGTIVYRTLEGKQEAFLADLAEPGARAIVAKGGRGGLGNQHFGNRPSAKHRDFRKKASRASAARCVWNLRLLRTAESSACERRQIDVTVGGIRRTSEDRRLRFYDDRTATRRRARSPTKNRT